MSASYRDLLGDRAHAALAFRSDLASYKEKLKSYSGQILDVGGGNGIVRQSLSPLADYTCLDPSVEWLEKQWESLSEDFPCLQIPIQFVRGVAEYMPFGDASFDGVLAFWSLNHCADPQRSLLEIGRVLRPSGKCLLVLEDAEPPWRDIFNSSYTDWRNWSRGRISLEKLKALFVGWPLQSDHLRIRESQIAEWTVRIFSIACRKWHGAYLTIELERASV